MGKTSGSQGSPGRGGAIPANIKSQFGELGGARAQNAEHGLRGIILGMLKIIKNKNKTQLLLIIIMIVK